MWLDALWGCVGAAVNCGLVFLEASRRAKGWPWPEPQGPGGGVYAVSVLIHLGIGAATATAVLGSGLIAPNILVAFGIGTATPVVVKKVSKYVESLIPGESDTQVGEIDAP
ncbi:hypothetical protein [Nocardia testacea]|uniref:hypothetical protein n=1 Tax=Nocardia testacea TaxID=248551 RepID=UPI0033BFF26D